AKKAKPNKPHHQPWQFEHSVFPRQGALPRCPNFEEPEAVRSRIMTNHPRYSRAVETLPVFVPSWFRVPEFPRFPTSNLCSIFKCFESLVGSQLLGTVLNDFRYAGVNPLSGGAAG